MSSALRPSTNPIASLAAKSMWRSRSASSEFILWNRSGRYAFPNVPAQFTGRTPIDFAAQHFGQLDFHAGQLDQAWDAPWNELNKHVDVAVFPEALRQNRAEQGKLPDVITRAESPEGLLRNLDGNRDCAQRDLYYISAKKVHEH